MVDREERLAHLQEANRKKTAFARDAVLAALTRRTLAADSININAVAESAGVSRGFIYSQPDLREKIAIASKLPRTKLRKIADSPRNDASLASRLEMALDEVHALKEENRALKQRIENLSAQLYDESFVTLRP